MLDFTNEQVRELKGAPLAMLVLLSSAAQPVTQEWLERFSGYSDKPVSQALIYLMETGRVAHLEDGWQLVDFSAPGPLPSMPDVGKTPRLKEKPTSGYDKTAQMDVFPPPASRKNPPQVLDARAKSTRHRQKTILSRKNSDPPLISSSKSLLSSKDLKDSKDFKDSNTTKTPKRKRKISNATREKLWDEFARLNLRRNARTEALAEMDHITVEYLRGMQAKLEREGRGGPRNTGLLITALESAEPVEHAVETVHESVAKFLGKWH